jgi:hypothetical protein
MATREHLLGQIDEAWRRGPARGGILVSDLADITADYTNRIFNDRESELTVHENADGLTVVGCIDPSATKDPRTILGAHLSSDGSRLYVEAHNNTVLRHHAPYMGAWVRGCRAHNLDLKDGSVSTIETAPHLHAPAEKPTTAEPYLTAARVRAAKVLGLFLEADVTNDVLRSSYARSKLTETHCTQEVPPLAHPSEAFYIPAVQQAICDVIPPSA